MLKKLTIYRVFLGIGLLIIYSILFGQLLRKYYLGKNEFQLLQNIAIFIVEIPSNTKQVLNYFKNRSSPPKLKKHKDKESFKQFIPYKRNALLVLPRYDHGISRSVVDIVDLNNFKVIHTYKHDIAKMHAQVKNTKKFNRINIDDSPNRFEYRHPLILNDGSLISDSENSIEFKIDFCSNLEWINEEEIFHHSKMLDHEGNLWIPGHMKPYSKYIKQYPIQNFNEDSIIKINTNGEILYIKSLMEILIENKIFDINNVDSDILQKNKDPVHLNDIEPALSDTQFWKKGDLFLSAKHLSAIIHYRPSNNKVINYIKGPFSQQHDVDIISDKEISIFNNNNFIVDNEFSEVIVYNFETKEFRKIFNNQLKNENFKTKSQGLSHIFNDGALMVEEQNHGRIILFNNQGQKEWEYVNKDTNGNIGFVSWSRVIEDQLFIEKFKLLIKNNKCVN